MNFTINHKQFLTWAFVGAALLTACKKDFLDQKTLSAVDEGAVYRDSAKTLGVINNLYGNIGFSFNARRFNNTGLRCCM
jgi:starch-binding outer membrane protein, SusD/RagB family